jgi:hypothetical protein
MAAVFDGRQCPRMTAVDTGSDTYAVIVSSSHITDADAQKVWDDTMGGGRMVPARLRCSHGDHRDVAAGCAPRHRPTIRQLAIRIDRS